MVPLTFLQPSQRHPGTKPAPSLGHPNVIQPPNTAQSPAIQHLTAWPETCPKGHLHTLQLILEVSWLPLAKHLIRPVRMVHLSLILQMNLGMKNENELISSLKGFKQI